MKKLIEGKTAISHAGLLQYGIPKGTIDAGRYNYSKGKYPTWAHTKLQGVTFFFLENLPTETKEKLPVAEIVNAASSTVFDAIIEAYKNQFLQIKLKNFAAKSELLRAEFPTMPNADITELAQRWAVWEWICGNFDRSNCNFQELHKAYCCVFPEHLQSYKSFNNYKGRCNKNGIKETVIDGRLLGNCPGRISDFQQMFIYVMYAKDCKYSSNDIHLKLIDACKEQGETPVSQSTVKGVMRELKRNPTAYAARYGADKAKQKMPYASFMPAANVNDQWQGDGWDIPLYGNGFAKYKVFILMDNNSRKIVGYSIGRQENTKLIMEALECGIRDAGRRLPLEFVFDKHSFHKTKIAGDFKRRTEALGVTWTVSTNPQTKAILERSFQYFNTFFKDFAGYLGQGITAKNEDARRSPETYAKLAAPVNQHTEAEIKSAMNEAIIHYNSLQTLPVLKGISPNEAFAAGAADGGLGISEAEVMNLIKPVQAHKVQRGQINIREGIIKHEFQLNAELIAKYNDRHLWVAYEDLTQGIYITDPETEEELGFVPVKTKIQGNAAGKKDKDIQALNKLKGRTAGISKKAQKDAIGKWDALLTGDPAAVDLIASYAMPKNIRTAALQNRELRLVNADMNVRVNNMPIRKQENPLEVMTQPMPKSAKSKNSPFTPTNHTVTVFDPTTLDD